MKMERFDVRLSAEDAARVRADMRRRGITSKAEQLRDSLRGGWAEMADGIATGIGELVLLLNDLVILVEDTAAVAPETLAALIDQVMKMLRALLRMINERGRA